MVKTTLEFLRFFFSYAKYFKLKISAPVLAKLDEKLNMKACTEYNIP